MNLLEQWNETEAKRKAGLITEQEEFDTIISRAESPRPNDAIRLGELAAILGIDAKTIAARLSAIVATAKAKREAAEAEAVLNVLKKQEAEIRSTLGQVITGDMTDVCDALTLVYYLYDIGSKVPMEPLARDAFKRDFLKARGWKEISENTFRDPKTGLEPVLNQAVMNAFRQIADPVCPLVKGWLAKRAFQVNRANTPVEPTPADPIEDAAPQPEQQREAIAPA